MGQIMYMQKDQVKQFLDGIETLRLRKMTHPQVRLMFETLLYGAMRISEVLQITPISLIGGKIRLETTKGGTKRCECSKWTFRPLTLVSADKECKKCEGLGKYRIPAYAWVLEEIYKELGVLARTKKSNERLFPISRVRAWQYCDMLLNCRTHTFRHSFLTWMLEAEKFNVRDIMQKARHKSLATTTTYIEKDTDYTIKKENRSMERI
jgi:integrase